MLWEGGAPPPEQTEGFVRGYELGVKMKMLWGSEQKKNQGLSFVTHSTLSQAKPQKVHEATRQCPFMRQPSGRTNILLAKLPLRTKMMRLIGQTVTLDGSEDSAPLFLCWTVNKCQNLECSSGICKCLLLNFVLLWSAHLKDFGGCYLVNVLWWFKVIWTFFSGVQNHKMCC